MTVAGSMWWTLTVACLLLAGAWSVHADTQVRSLFITTDIKDHYATTQVYCRVVNTADEPADAPFSVTFPDTAFVTAFSIEYNGRVIKAEVKENSEVKYFNKEYGVDLITEFYRDANRFSIVFIINAKENVIFKLTYEELLVRRLGAYTNIVHINPQQIVNNLKVTVNIEEPMIIKNLEVLQLNGSEKTWTKSNLAKIDDEDGPKIMRIIWAPGVYTQGEINPNGVQGQLAVKYDLDRLEFAETFVVDEGHFFTNYLDVDAVRAHKKHIIFVLDYSYSMEGQKLDRLKQAIDDILLQLRTKDYFSIVTTQSFAEAWSPTALYRAGPDGQDNTDREHMHQSEHTLTQTLSPQFLVAALSDNVELALKYLQDTKLGGSFLIGGLKAGLDLAGIGANHWQEESNPPVPTIIFVSGGVPTTGEVNETAILDQVAALNPKQVPIYSLAYGYYADYDFLQKLSLSNFGSARKIYDDDDASAQILNYYNFIDSPIATNVSINYLPTKVSNRDLTRLEFPVYYRGSEIVIAGKLIKENYTDNYDETIGKLTATLAHTNSTQKYPILSGAVHQGNFAEKTFAYLKIREYLDELATLPDSFHKGMTEVRVVTLAEKYSFVTPLTSLLLSFPNGRKYFIQTTSLKQAPPLDKTELKKIVWLQKLLTDDTAAQVSVALQDRNYNVALTPSDETFGKCVANHMAGECRHFQKCVLAIFRYNVSDFLPYKCDITGNYLGVCCPVDV
uniref:VWFA domain-containing protein n=1 Tax=Graphocephala atropunctata TaxID=36148 RepID=A0A1B6MHI5_9HEMI